MSTTTGAGLEGVIAGESEICYIDGYAGILSYRGYNIHTLADHASFEEVVYLLWNGRLPGRAELSACERREGHEGRQEEGSDESGSHGPILPAPPAGRTLSYCGLSSSAERSASPRSARFEPNPPLVSNSASSRASARLSATVVFVRRPRSSKSERSRLVVDRPASAAATSRSSPASRSERVTSFPITSSFTNRGAACLTDLSGLY